ncbi:MAG: YdcF family protein [Desulfobacterales bacterium]|nr:YdcF family protein [Desulfobacterales bacterium]
MYQLLTFNGVPADVMQLQNESRNTYEDALFCAEIPQSMGVKDIVLVTSGFAYTKILGFVSKAGYECHPWQFR